MAYPLSPSSGVNATRPGAIQGVTAPARTIDTKRKRFRLGLFRRRRCPGARRTCHCDAAVTCCYCRTSVASIPEWCPAPPSPGAVRADGIQDNGHRPIRLQAAHTARAPCHPYARRRGFRASSFKHQATRRIYACSCFPSAAARNLRRAVAGHESRPIHAARGQDHRQRGYDASCGRAALPLILPEV